MGTFGNIWDRLGINWKKLGAVGQGVLMQHFFFAVWISQNSPAFSKFCRAGREQNGSRMAAGAE
jgi:hypothetical protein